MKVYIEGQGECDCTITTTTNSSHSFLPIPLPRECMLEAIRAKLMHPDSQQTIYLGVSVRHVPDGITVEYKSGKMHIPYPLVFPLIMQDA